MIALHFSQFDCFIFFDHGLAETAKPRKTTPLITAECTGKGNHTSEGTSFSE